MRSLRDSLLFTVALGLAVPAAAQHAGHAPQTYGTSAVSYVEIPAEAFLPLDSSYAYSLGAWETARYSTNCAGFCFGAPLNLPSGALIVYLELDFSDGDSDNYEIGTLLVCDSLGVGCSNHPALGGGPVDCLTAGQICSGAGYGAGHASQSADMTPDALTVDNQHNSYRLRAGGSAAGEATQIAGMVVGYVLQVSPPPATADFGDVPTSHPFFQYIEALYHSGVTGGCGGGNYCPDNPVTRGQMAVFLAKALGLQWP